MKWKFFELSLSSGWTDWLDLVKQTVHRMLMSHQSYSIKFFSSTLSIRWVDIAPKTRLAQFAFAQRWLWFSSFKCKQIENRWKTFCSLTFFNKTLFYFFVPGVSNVMNVPVSPVLAALVLTAAILFAIVCIVLATIYRKHSHK